MYEKFAKLLEEKHVTAYQVSKATGISTATLSAWKNGDYTPKIDKLTLIAEFFSVPITDFIDTGKRGGEHND